MLQKSKSMPLTRTKESVEVDAGVRLDQLIQKNAW